jgi:hypothetical protein
VLFFDELDSIAVQRGSSSGECHECCACCVVRERSLHRAALTSVHEMSWTPSQCSAAAAVVSRGSDGCPLVLVPVSACVTDPLAGVGGVICSRWMT